MESRLSFTDGNFNHLFLALMPFSYGFIGVAIFFLVSGFCIHLSHARSKRQEYKVFFVRRFFRIYPPYFLALCFFAFVFPFTMLKLNSFINVAQFVSHVLMVHNLDPRSFFGINGALLLTGVIEMTLRWVSGVVVLPYLISASPFYAWFSWSLGAKLADDYLHGRPLFLAKCPLWVGPCMFAVAYTVKPIFAFTFPCVAISTATVIAYFISRPAVRVPLPRILCNALRQIGIISYSVYLLHGPLLAFLPRKIRATFPGHDFSPLEIGICLLFFCVFVLFISWLFYRFVELPGIELGKWVLKRMPPKPAPALAQERVTS